MTAATGDALAPTRADPPTVGGLLQQAPLPINEARALLAHVLGLRREKLVAWPERTLTEAEFNAYDSLLARRSQGEPMAYLLGVQEFYGLAFRVSPAVLIPRPETELLVDLARAYGADDAGLAILDLGTGSGCIAVSVALGLPRAQVVAVDISADALVVAQDNVVRHGAHVQCLHGDWYAPVAGQRFGLILANPPYVRAGDAHLSALRYEPALALTGGDGGDGLASMRRVVAGAATHLTPGGSLLVEHGHDQAAAVRALMTQAGLVDVQSIHDLAGHERVCAGRWPGGTLAPATRDSESPV